MARAIDDVNKRKRYKEEQYGKKKSRTDDYTGERVFSGNARDSQYKHPSNKTSDTDHITPIKVVEERYKGLSKEQQQALVNNNHNYATVNSKLNRSKGDLENHQYLYRQIKKGEGENLETTVRMISKEIESRVVMRAEATVMYTQEIMKNTYTNIASEEFRRINKAGKDSAFDAAVFAATLSITENAKNVIKGDVNKKEAIQEVLSDTVTVATLAYATGTVMEKMQLGNSEASLLVTGTVQISKQMLAYVNGDINEEQLMSGIAETSAYLAAAYAGKYIGLMIGNTIAPGMGGYIGQCIGEMITTAVCSEVISNIKCSKEFDRQNSKMISLYKRAESEIRSSQERLEYIIQKENNELMYTVRDGFEEILKGIQANSYEQIESGMAVIGSKFGLTQEALATDSVTRKGLFSHSDDILEIE